MIPENNKPEKKMNISLERVDPTGVSAIDATVLKHQIKHLKQGDIVHARFAVDHVDDDGTIYVITPDGSIVYKIDESQTVAVFSI